MVWLTKSRQSATNLPAQLAWAVQEIGHVKRTAEGISCVLRVRTADWERLLSAALPQGILISSDDESLSVRLREPLRCRDTVIRWILRPTECRYMRAQAAARNYWNTVAEVAANARGKIKCKFGLPDCGHDSGSLDPDTHCPGICVREPNPKVPKLLPNSYISCPRCGIPLCGYSPCAIMYPPPLVYSRQAFEKASWLCRNCDTVERRFPPYKAAPSFPLPRTTTGQVPRKAPPPELLASFRDRHGTGQPQARYVANAWRTDPSWTEVPICVSP